MGKRCPATNPFHSLSQRARLLHQVPSPSLDALSTSSRITDISARLHRASLHVGRCFRICCIGCSRPASGRSRGWGRHTRVAIRPAKTRAAGFHDEMSKESQGFARFSSKFLNSSTVTDAIMAIIAMSERLNYMTFCETSAAFFRHRISLRCRHAAAEASRAVFLDSLHDPAGL